MALGDITNAAAAGAHVRTPTAKEQRKSRAAERKELAGAASAAAEDATKQVDRLRELNRVLLQRIHALQTEKALVYKSTTQASSAVDHARNAVEKQTATATVAVAACASAEAAAGVSQHSLRAASPKLARQLEKAKVATKAALEEAAELRKQVAIRDAKIADLAASASEAAAQAAESREETRATEEVLKNAWRAVDTLEARQTQLQSSLDAAEEALAASKEAPARNKDTYVRRLVGRLAFGAVWAAGVFLLHSGAKRADKLRRMPKGLVPKALWPRYR